MGIISEQMLSFSEAARRLPPGRGGRPVSPATIWRWVRDGCRASDGRVIRLESARIGGRSITSVEALSRFSAALSGQTVPAVEEDETATPGQRTPGQRQRASERAAKQLEEAGI